jgi:Protein of unknown function (DUF1592)/Protein of unknown function (DUF1588)/Protein of unknown function (DUF1595)/Protein of unknown function (DUF1587)/Protein of unknown function (DUF1585)
MQRPMMMNRLSMAALLGLLAATACGDGTLENDGSGALPGARSNGDTGDTTDPNAAGAAGSNPNTRIVRLSHEQYANTLRDLFGIEETPEGSFAPDALNGFNFNTSNDLRVDPRLGPQYRSAAEQVALQAVQDDGMFQRIVPCDAASAGCAGEFIDGFGARVFRRPLSGDESARFQALFNLGTTLGDSGNAFDDGVQLVVEAMLQAPQFLYRTEVSNGAVQNGRAALDDWEVASRLSYFIYDSMPDEELFASARAGQLHTPEQVGSEVARMLADPRAQSKLASFHEQVWQVGRYSKIAPDAATYPGLPADLVDHLLASSSRFVESVIADGGGLRELLTAPYAYADSELGPLYDADVSGNALQRIDFENGERKGFMMQAGFLASNAYSRKTDPIHRGLFILRDMLCRLIPDPPPGAQNTPPPETDQPINTTRQEISLLTGQLYCPTCHSQINEPGFAFEGFDAVGQPREQENGVDVDTTGSITLDGTPVPFSGAGELVEALADSQEAQNCYTSRWLEFTYGRTLTERDDPLRARLAEQPRSVQDIVQTMTTSTEFLSRDVTEAAQ